MFGRLAPSGYEMFCSNLLSLFLVNCVTLLSNVAFIFSLLIFVFCLYSFASECNMHLCRRVHVICALMSGANRGTYVLSHLSVWGVVMG